ncbi:MAG TPA: hypothetical protein VE944_23975 [Nostoc sp.]|nr:hypothetical protein [Nostoc sp.]HYX17355.1 hypothetical protein [Nostoc sp.]
MVTPILKGLDNYCDVTPKSRLQPAIALAAFLFTLATSGKL